MTAEQKIVEFVSRTNFEQIPAKTLKVIRNQVLGVIGTTNAGATADGCETLYNLTRELGGKEESTILIHGGKVPAEKAAFMNAVMARALDFDDALAPGAHLGAAIVPAALAAAELAGGCSGKDLLTAITVGTEVALRFNLGEAEYDGFDPTGVCVILGAAAAAAKILRLSEDETWNALALAFNRLGGSFQSNVDGALAVRVIEGWAAESGVLCARFAGRGITGPRNFIEGVYGYLHLFGRDRISPEAITTGLGEIYNVEKLVFKKYPSCGLTQGSTGVILGLMKEESFGVDDVEHVYVTVPPYTYKLVGHHFQLGANLKVNAQFNIQYCVANALMRKSSKLAHFEEDAIRDSEVLKLVEKVTVISDATLEKRGHTPLDMRLVMKDGREFVKSIEVARGFPGNPLNDEEHRERFQDCLAFAQKPLPAQNIENIMEAVDQMESLEDIRSVIPFILLN